MAAKTLDEHIEITPGIAGGKPRIAGHRITVHNIVVWHERLGWSADEIAAEYDLSLADVYAALAYYFDHRLWAIHRDLKEQEKASGRKIVSFPPKRRRPVEPAMALEHEPTTSANK